MTSFWRGLPKPFFAMAPMADVTDVAFRALVAKRGKPNVFWTEFVSADGLYHTIERRKDGTTIYGSAADNPLLRDLLFTEEQRPIVAQFFSRKPEMISYATRLVAELGFDGVDINMGCPDESIEKQGCGAAMIKSPDVARAVVRAAKIASDLPVSIKTRIGYNKESLDEWLPILLREAPAAITIHLRTRKEMSHVPAHWDVMKKAVEIRNKINPNVLLIGNGDVQSVEQGSRLAAETGCDGVMVGRGMFGNPWVFAGRKPADTPLHEKLEALTELATNFEKLSPRKNFAILKKHIKAFVTGFDGATELRARLMEANSAADMERIISENRV